MRTFILPLVWLLLAVSPAWAADLGLTPEQFHRDFATYAERLGIRALPDKPVRRESAAGKVTETYAPHSKITIRLVHDSSSKRISNVMINAKAEEYEDGKRAQHYFLSLMAVFIDLEEGRSAMKALGIIDGSIFDGVPRTWKSSGRELVLSFDERSGLLLRINAY